MSLTEPAQPLAGEPPRTKAASRWAIPLLGAMAAIQGADPNIASTALVGVSRGLDMAGGLLALAASVSTLALSASVISTGLLADRLGRRRVLMAALALAALGDVVAGLAPVPVVFLLGRVLAGVGLGAVFGASFAYIRVVTPPGRIAGAIGVFGAVCGTVTLGLTFLGGSLSSIDWRLAFVVIPLGAALCIIAVRVVLPDQPPMPGGPADIPGQALLASPTCSRWDRCSVGCCCWRCSSGGRAAARTGSSRWDFSRARSLSPPSAPASSTTSARRSASCSSPTCGSSSTA
jgi:MFS family permease